MWLLFMSISDQEFKLNSPLFYALNEFCIVTKDYEITISGIFLLTSFKRKKKEKKKIRCIIIAIDYFFFFKK